VVNLPDFPIKSDQGDSRQFSTPWRDFAFADHPMSRSPDHPIFAALCPRPSAKDPTPQALLLKTKAQPQFDKTVTRLSMPFLGVFLGSNLAQFQPSFSAFAVRSAEGRKAATFWLNTDC
jgi:hypothetical protein